MGLGLNITEKIVKKFGGEIGFRSEHNVGSTFSFSFQLESDLENLSISDYFARLQEENGEAEE